jgi:hypothetical protein
MTPEVLGIEVVFCRMKGDAEKTGRVLKGS